MVHTLHLMPSQNLNSLDKVALLAVEGLDHAHLILVQAVGDTSAKVSNFEWHLQHKSNCPPI